MHTHKERPWTLSGFWEEEAEDPIARTEKESLLGFPIGWEFNTENLDLEPKSNWVLEEMKADEVGKLRLWEPITHLRKSTNKLIPF